MLRFVTLMLFLTLLNQAGVSGAWTGATIVDDKTPEVAVRQPPLADSYAVQAGRFRNEAEARELAARLRDKGYQPHVLSARDSDGVWYAVRLSLHESPDEAQEAARAFSEKESRQAVVAISGSTSAIAGQTLYFLQAGAFLKRENAREQLQAFAQQGYAPGLLTLDDKKGRLWHIVHVGVFKNLPQAREAAAVFSEKTGRKCYINAIDPQLFEQRRETVE